jgi:hypothetical protein
MAMFSGFGSLYMTFVVLMSCFYQQITELNPVTGELLMNTRTGYGMLARQIEHGETADYQQCIYYPDDEKFVLEDTFMKGSTYSAYVCAALQVICCLVLSTTCCCAYNRPCWERWMMWTYIWASCFMALTFLMFGAHFCKENDCDVANGSAMAISAWMFLICCANMVKNMGQPPPDDMVDPDDDEDNLWYDDDADRFPQRYDEDDEYYEDDDEYDEFGGEEEFYDEDINDTNNNNTNTGLEMQDQNFYDPQNQGGGMVPYGQDPNAPPPLAPNDGGMVLYGSDPNAPLPPPPAQDVGGMVSLYDDDYNTTQPPTPNDSNDPYNSQSRTQVGGFDGPELL